MSRLAPHAAEAEAEAHRLSAAEPPPFGTQTEVRHVKADLGWAVRSKRDYGHPERRREVRLDIEDYRLDFEPSPGFKAPKASYWDEVREGQLKAVKPKWH